MFILFWYISINHLTKKSGQEFAFHVWSPFHVPLYTHLINIIEPWTKTGHTDRCKVNIDKVVSRIPGQTSGAHLGAIILWSIRCQLFNLAGSSVSDQYSTAAMRESTHAGRSVLLSQRGPNEDNVDSFVLGWQIWSRVHGASFWPTQSSDRHVGCNFLHLSSHRCFLLIVSAA